MPGTAVLDTAIGLAFVFFLVALLCSAVVEAIANVMKKRAKYLLRGLRDILDTPDVPDGPEHDESMVERARAIRDAATAESTLYMDALGAKPHVAAPPAGSPAVAPPTPPANAQNWWTLQLMGHPLVRPFKQSRAAGKQTRNPSYLPTKAFAAALVDLLVPDAQGNTTLTDIRTSVQALGPDAPFKKALLSLMNTANDDVNAFMTSLERWYDDQMDRISGSYKRWAKRWVIVIGLVAAAALQVDTIAVGNALYSDGPLREAVVAAATNGSLCEQSGTFQDTRRCVDQELTSLRQSTGLPVGWSESSKPTDVWSWAVKAAGWSLTAFAASFGAPFWFAALNKLGSLRNTGSKPRATT